jgi:TolB-like protein
VSAAFEFCENRRIQRKKMLQQARFDFRLDRTMLPGEFRLALIGPFGLFAPDGRRVAISSRKGIALVSTLAMARSGERSRAWLQTMLWGSRDTEQAQASLRRELANLRLALNGAAPCPLLVGPSIVRLNLEQVTVDVRLLELDVRAGRPHNVTGYSDFLEGLDIPGEEGFEDWLRGQRQMVRELIERSRTVTWQGLNATVVEAAAVPAQTLVERALGADPRLPNRPSIAVLPFASMTDSGGDDYVAEGIAEEVSTALTAFSTLLVVSSGRIGRSPPVDRQHLCRELGVRYLLEGSIRRAGDQIRATVRLVDGIVGEQIWAERFDEAFHDIFALQDRIAAAVAPRIDSSIESAERARALARPVASPDAYHLYWRANALFRRWDRASMLEAIQLVDQVLAIEPANAWAAGLAAFSNAAACQSRWTDDPSANRAAALVHYDRAMRFGGDDPFVLGYAAGTLICLGGDMRIADRLIDRALQLHPNATATLFWGGWVDIAIGNFGRGMERFDSALRLNPRSAVRPYSITGIAVCMLALGRTEEAVAILAEAVQHLPQYPMTLAALCVGHALLGLDASARAYADRLTAAGGLGPVLAVLTNDSHRAFMTSGVERAMAITRPELHEPPTPQRITA